MTNESNDQTNPEIEPQQVDTDVEAGSVEESVDVAEELLSEEQQKINELELALATAKSAVAEQKDTVIRAKAEVENIRRRAAQDVEKARKFALEKFAGELLPVIDNLERAVQSIDKDNEATKAVGEGVELTLQSFLSAIGKFDLKPIDPQDQPFNPELHQAMSMQEVPGVAPNTVIAVMQKGYELNGRLVRPAMVMVSKAAPSVDTSA